MALWLVSSSGDDDDGALRREAPGDDRGEDGDDDDDDANRKEGVDDATGREEDADEAAPLADREEDVTVSRRRALIGKNIEISGSRQKYPIVEIGCCLLGCDLRRLSRTREPG